MIFLRKQLPVAIAFVLGMFTLIIFYIPAPAMQGVGDRLKIFVMIIGAFAMLLGINSILGQHIEKIGKKRSGYGYSWVLIIGFVAMMIAWIPWWAAPPEGAAVYYPWGGLENNKGVFYWMFFWILVPMQATMFSILAFFIASAAYRSFRAKTLEATVLLVAAVIVMLGRVPLGTSLTSWLSDAGFWNNLRLETMTSWLLNIPNAAGFRGIVLGVALGIIATSVRIIFGVEKTYLGGGD
ncbi:MAG: hypothetical protein A2Y63_05375 [Candidatus Riflebacteria bacterium RBG_13_59_9]|nr:MAG: hypothetical protein A2Y63_05375 [Candidatus Riflebacteria bacterium RBG_13_59_9]